MRKYFGLSGQTSPLLFAIFAPAVLLCQHLFVIVTFWQHDLPLKFDWLFWLFPIRQVTSLPDVSSQLAALAFVMCLISSWLLGLLSYRRANWSGMGHWVAILSIIPTIQLLAVACMMVMPKSKIENVDGDSSTKDEKSHKLQSVLLGILAGVGIIVMAVVISALTFGAYGWGLFVGTPLLVGVTTAYFANKEAEKTPSETMLIVVASSVLGCIALLMLALEGLMCIILVAPLGAVAGILGGIIGRSIALAGHSSATPLRSVAILPLILAADGIMPPAAHLHTYEEIEIAATPNAVWKAITEDRQISEGPGIVGLAGLAYPVSGHIENSGKNGSRVGVFSTGIALEKITQWEPNKQLTLQVVSQPPAMEEMSPYRTVHAPHLEGYFDTDQTGFQITELPNGNSRLKITSSHILKIEPVVYWEPIAKWAIGQNVQRVLRSIKKQAEAQGTNTVSRASSSNSG